jgi:hypothetical protein
MANANYKKINNLLIVDPNPCGQKNIEIEKLNLSVELEVYNRDDDIIIFDTTNKTTTLKGTKQEKTRLSFIDSGGAEESFLTTHYTELNTTFNKANPDLDTLGIESINISFNTSYVPIVKIKFKDVRGKLFEMGNDSPYAFLFRMPYPIFYLTVKGYFGKPVRYALHMTKFSGSLDNDTGSYIISCDFIGYTYAFLTDILMGYIKAIPYTTNGKLLIAKDSSFMSFEQLRTIILKLEKVIQSYKKNDKRLASLSIFTDLITKLERIELSINQVISQFKDSYNGQVLISSSTDYADKVLITPKEIDDQGEKAYKSTSLEIVSAYNKYVIEKKIGKYALDIDDFALDDNGVYYDRVLLENINKTWQKTGTGVDISYQATTNPIGNFKKVSNASDAQIEQSFNEFKDILISEDFNKVFSNKTIDYSVYDFRIVTKLIKKLKTDIASEINEVKNVVTTEFIKKIREDMEAQGIFFDPSIGTIFEVLCNHVDLFINAIRMVGEKVKSLEGTEARRLSFLNDKELPDFRGVIDKDSYVRAFPEYIELDADGGYVDKWIGNNEKFERSPEVIFINDLYEALLKSRKKDADWLSNHDVNGEALGWYPVNPLETSIINSTNTNPWNLIGNLTTKEVYKLLVQRMVTFLAYSNKSLSEAEINDMAIIEAEQSFSAMKNTLTKASMITGEINDDVINKNISDINESNLKFYGLTYNTDAGYIYNGPSLQGATPIISSDLDKSFLAITQSKAQLKQEDNYILDLMQEGRLATSEIFGSRLISGNDDNGETFIKIIDNHSYNKNSLAHEDYSGIVSNKPPDNHRVTKEFDITSNIGDVNYIYGGLYKTPEFTKSGIYESYTNFYETSSEVILGYRNTDKPSKYDTFIKVDGEFTYNEEVKPCDTPEKVAELRKLSKPHSDKLKDSLRNKANNNLKFKLEPTFQVNHHEYSLFGSDFYYSQTTDNAKALLFLHTIPFEGMGNDTNGLNGLGDLGLLVSKVVNFFNQRAGVIEIPHSWGLFMGAILFRMDSEEEIISFSREVNGVDVSLVPEMSVDELSRITTDDYLNGYSQDPATTKSTLISQSKSNNLGFNNGNYQTFRGISDVIKNLPKSARDEFKNLFTSWVGSDFQHIKSAFEIYTSNYDSSTIDTVINDITSALSTNNNLNPEIKNNYTVVSAIDTSRNLFLELREDSKAEISLTKLLTTKKLIINGTYRIWDSELGEDLYSPITLSDTQTKSYLVSYLKHFRELNVKINIDDDSKNLNKLIFNTTNVDDIKLKLYKNVKAIYDKWIVGIAKGEEKVITEPLFNRFKFIDRSYKDISELFKISPSGLANQIVESNNVNFYNFIARILVDNNFDFIPLPTFIDYNDPKEVAEVFEPFSFNETVNEAISGPQFICMYIGERSNKLDIQEQHGINKNDGWDVKTSCKNGDLLINDASRIPNDFKLRSTGLSQPTRADLTADSIDRSNSSSIPYFLVSYADQNQSMFKNIHVDQMEFTETDEGLQIIDDLSKRNRNNSVGQNLFDIYSNRSYSAEIEMLGCAQIQPFMYFQLNNIPMFNGAYTIINTSHIITPNHMTTKFKGVRVRYAKTKMVDDETLYLNLIGNLDEVTNDGVNYEDAKRNEEKSKAKTIPNEKSDSTTKVRGATPKQTQILVKKYFQNLGEPFTKEIVAGIMSNIQHESSFDLSISVVDNDGFQTIGLIQWNSRFHGAALALFKAKKFSTVDEQLGYLLKMDDWSKFISDATKRAYDEQYTAFLFAYHVERCCACRTKANKATRGVLTRQEYTYKNEWINGDTCFGFKAKGQVGRSITATQFMIRFNDPNDSLYWNEAIA